MANGNKHNITLIAYDILSDQFLEKIAEDVNRQFGLPVIVRVSNDELLAFYDPFRKQYDGNRLLQEMGKLAPPEAIKTMGLFRVDLFIPILTYLFGQAVLNGSTAVASLYRLKNELYGLPKNEGLLLERFIKVIIHELGHTFGLKHCHTPGCIMISSTYVEDLDQKEQAFCPECTALVGKAIVDIQED